MNRDTHAIYQLLTESLVPIRIDDFVDFHWNNQLERGRIIEISDPFVRVELFGYGGLMSTRTMRSRIIRNITLEEEQRQAVYRDIGPTGSHLTDI